MPNAIEVHNLSKKFVHYPSPRDRFIDLATGGKVKRGTDFWALQDINFEIPQGTTFGIIGQNGSGKSTLLSILAGVLHPTWGTFKVRGRVAAILELGSGFHGEFTGRENIYIYGAILGLSRLEIERRFDDIVDFSELHEFIDRPLFTYSSGMVARLAFAVVINVDADILIIDEVLAVGDMLFQMRCLRQIKRMQEDGKTILYVGHDLNTIRNLCDSAILLDNGRIVERGDTNIVANVYQALIIERQRVFKENFSIKKSEAVDIRLQKSIENGQEVVRFGPRDVEVVKVEMLDSTLLPRQLFNSGEFSIIQVQLHFNAPFEDNVNVGFIIRNKYGDIYGANAYWLGHSFGPQKCGATITIEFSQKLYLAHGIYTLSVASAITLSAEDSTIFDWNNDIYTFEITSSHCFAGIIDLQTSIKSY